MAETIITRRAAVQALINFLEADGRPADDTTFITKKEFLAVLYLIQALEARLAAALIP